MTLLPQIPGGLSGTCSWVALHSLSAFCCSRSALCWSSYSARHRCLILLYPPTSTQFVSGCSGSDLQSKSSFSLTCCLCRRKGGCTLASPKPMLSSMLAAFWAYLSGLLCLPQLARALLAYLYALLPDGLASVMPYRLSNKAGFQLYFLTIALCALSSQKGQSLTLHAGACSQLIPLYLQKADSLFV